MCTLLAVFAILHIMQDVKERIAFLELLDSYVGNIPALEKIFLSGSEKQPRFKRLTVTKQFGRITMLSTASGVLRLPDPLGTALTLRHQKPLTAL